MIYKFILSDYINEAMSLSVYDKLEDGTFAGKIPGFIGIIAFGDTLKDCENEVRSVLEDWIFLGLKLSHKLPVVSGINLNKKPKYEQVSTM